MLLLNASKQLFCPLLWLLGDFLTSEQPSGCLLGVAGQPLSSSGQQTSDAGHRMIPWWCANRSLSKDSTSGLKWDHAGILCVQQKDVLDPFLFSLIRLPRRVMQGSNFLPLAFLSFGLSSAQASKTSICFMA